MKVADPNFASVATMPSDASETTIRAAFGRGEPVAFPPDGKRGLIDASWIRELGGDAGECTKWILVANATIAGALALPHIVFRGPVSFINCEFRDDVDFTGAEFKRSLVMKKSTFAGALDMTQISIAYNLDLSACEVSGPLSLLDAEVSQVLRASGVSLNAAELGRLHVRKAAFFLPIMDGLVVRPAHFRESARFLDARFDVTLELDGARFDGEANFSRVTVGAQAFFRTAAMAAVLGKRDPIQIPAEAQPHFTARSNIKFRDGQFGSGADFQGARFEADADFTRINVQSDLFCKETTFKGRALFAGATVGADADFSGARFEAGASFFRMTTAGALFLQGAELQEIDLRRATIGAISIDETTRLQKGIDARGLSHQRFGGDWRRFGNAVAPFTPDPFDDIEQYLRTSADDREADAVYYLRRMRERRVRTDRVWKALRTRRIGAVLSELPRLALDMFEAASGYGVKPLRFILLAAIILALGTLVFSQKNAVVSKTAKADPPRAETLSKPHAAFSYAFSTFIPIVRLPPVERWPPNDIRVPVAAGRSLPITYEGVAMILQFSGYLVAPLVIAIVKAMISRRERA